MSTLENFKGRIIEMQREYYDVRQYSIGNAQDVEGWHVSRLMRDARTASQLDEVDRRLRRWINSVVPNSGPRIRRL